MTILLISGCGLGNTPRESDSSERTVETTNECTVLASFLEVDGHPPAIVKCKVGQGVAILTGIHFEWHVEKMDKNDPYLDEIIPLLQSSQPMMPKWMNSVLTHLGLESNVVTSASQKLKSSL